MTTLFYVLNMPPNISNNTTSRYYNFNTYNKQQLQNFRFLDIKISKRLIKIEAYIHTYLNGKQNFGARTLIVKLIHTD